MSAMQQTIYTDDSYDLAENFLPVVPVVGSSIFFLETFYKSLIA